MYKLHFLPKAKDDLQSIVDYYDKINILLTNAFIDEVVSFSKFIGSAPKVFPKKHKNIRVCFLKKFKYGIYYKINNNQIIILAIMHTSRNPQNWKIRVSL